MTLELSPEIEALIQRRLQSGAFSTAEEVIERALEFFSAEEDWLAANRESISARIQEGWEEVQAGELTDEEGVRSEMRQFKEDWKRQHQPG
jgi:Arc/MetJ-type ribon-helix-helix transcriptional regulator